MGVDGVSTLPIGRRLTDRGIWLLRVVSFVTLYVVAGRLGLELTYYHDAVTLVVWPAAGVGLAGLILYGRRMWPCVFVGALLVHLSLPTSLAASIGITIGSTLESFVGATLLVEVFEFRPRLERVRDGALFMLVGVLGCTMISATIGTGSIYLSGGLMGSFGSVWLIWWLSEVGGVLVFTPLLLMLAQGSPPWKSLLRRIEFWFVFATLVAMSVLAFHGPDFGLLGFAMAMAPIPGLVWAGSRLGPRGATLASFLIIVIATFAAGIGSGPFALGTTTEAMFMLWPYSIFIGVMAFTLAAVVEQSALADRRYRSEELERLHIEKQKLLLVERERVTRELHDGLGGQLVSVLSMVERGLTVPSDVAEALRRAIDDIGIVIDSLDPETTDLSTSLGKLRARLDPLLGRNGIELNWDVEDILDADEFPPEVTLHILRIIQEAVTNSLQHSNAGRVEVSISVSGADERRCLRIRVADDGCGLQTGPSLAGRGVKNMNSRAKELGAELRMEGTDSGTRIELAIPLRSSF